MKAIRVFPVFCTADLNTSLSAPHPAAVRSCSGEACRVCPSPTESLKVTVNLQLSIRKLKIPLLCTSFCFNVISLEFSVKCPWQADHTLYLGGTGFCCIGLSSYCISSDKDGNKDEWLSYVERGVTRKCGDICWLIVLLWCRKGCYELVVEYNTKICHSMYLK